MAGGNSRRFGTNKLMQPLDGIFLYRHLLNRLIRICSRHAQWDLNVVTQYPEIKQDLRKEPVTVRFCSKSRLGASWSVKAGMEGITDEGACVFFVADQPFLREESAEGFLMEMEKRQARLGCAAYENQAGNPVWFHRLYFKELKQLKGDQGGRKILRKYPEEVIFYQIEEARELEDIDYLEDMP